ncbi:alanine-glyoxylate transaminase/serine-glyoxylate transaminase/serine-pyruvate transaminase [Herbaspirillum sp. Sphag1AN]|uniref:pyridoxal-phosphate-dependent aminotransferase family protein n=1 Tax=unclassified Herbaspirillum TaxID=2624150 RepID=UPI001619ECE2|nr:MULTISPECIES: aminotransferase class V-fold PLP-dependent enzyme [unclassified Herbaspirillum]MBB3211112.1 alanine-glyoxylate transaminase/serine-glyoxylate transaminase/serine-pyruvate transaminase [Herbaspirillum sp. Sphag1AN]MBB3244741.1 alanine-glyoxylate transaminase/serine-glyoxylate transaminase/serine-pyruvate transaminase [Herbaspirillum sp. Sphag64]
MLKLDFHPAGRHFLQIPGPSPVPDRILRAMSYPTIDHRGPEFGALGLQVLAGIKKIFKTEQPVVIYPASGTGAWEAALTNTLSAGDHVLMVETGHFATLWKKMAEALGLQPEFLGLPGIEGWRRGVQPEAIEQRLRQDSGHQIKAVCVVHNETSTGVTSDIAAVRRAIDAAGHPALLLVDTISGLASADYRHDEWGVDVTVSGSQKGLMLPPGISFNAVSKKALEASKHSRLPKAFWGWTEIIEMNASGYWPYTPNTNLLYGLSEALDMILGEGLDNVFARHQRLAAACRAAVNAWGLQIQCADPAVYSPVLTGVMTPAGFDADAIRKTIYENFNMSLGTGLGKMKGRMFRIGHLGEANELTLMATLAGCEMGLQQAGVKLAGSGVAAAMQQLMAQQHEQQLRKIA